MKCQACYIEHVANQFDCGCIDMSGTSGYRGISGVNGISEIYNMSGNKVLVELIRGMIQEELLKNKE